MKLIKAHAFGNDFLLLDGSGIPAATDVAALARATCERHRGVGADGLLVYRDDDAGVSMQLLNADGSASEISGNGLRCLAALLVHRRPALRDVRVRTDAGMKHLELLDRSGSRFTFRAAMGQPEDVRLESLTVGADVVEAVTLRVGNPQCVVLGPVTEERLHGLGKRLAVHPRFPAGTNVELATVAAPDHVRILIWERGVGPTEASGTGACAAAVAAMQFGGATRDARIESPGGTQRVEWRDDGLFLTGWAELVADAEWLGGVS